MNHISEIVNQLDLLRPSHPPKEPHVSAPYQEGSITSKRAAREIEGKSAAMRVNVYNAIKAAGARGITRKELEEVTGYKVQTLCARLNELEMEMKAIKKMTRLNERMEEEILRREGCSIYTAIRVAA